MQQILIGGSSDDLDNTITEYNLFNSRETWISAESRRQQLIATAGIIDNLFIELETAPGEGKSYIFTLRVNGAPSALTVTISNTDTTGNDIIHSVSVSAGDSICIEAAPSGTPDVGLGADSWWTCRFIGTTDQESLILGVSEATLDAAATEYTYLENGNGNWEATEAYQIIPTNGTLKKLYVELESAPGAGKSYVFTLRINGANGIITCTVSDTNITANDLVNTIAVSAGDTVGITVTPSGTPNIPRARWGLIFAPSINGESILLGGSTNALNTTTTEYALIATGETVWSSSENSRSQNTLATTYKKLFVKLQNAPTAGKSFTFALRANAGTTDITVAISGTNTTGNNIINTYSASNDDQLTFQCIPANTPTIGEAYWGIVSYIAPSNYDCSFSVDDLGLTFSLGTPTYNTAISCTILAPYFSLALTIPTSAKTTRTDPTRIGGCPFCGTLNYEDS